MIHCIMGKSVMKHTQTQQLEYPFYSYVRTISLASNIPLMVLDTFLTLVVKRFKQSKKQIIQQAFRLFETTFSVELCYV